MNQTTNIELFRSRSLPIGNWSLSWWQPLLLTALVVWLYASTFVHLVLQWGEDADFSHGYLVPAFSLFVLWRERDRLLSIPRRPSLWGIALIIFSLLLLVTGMLGAELFLERISFIFLMAGFVLLFCGTAHLKAMLFPLCFLVLMVPIPSILFTQVTFPLQIFASRLASTILPLLGVPVLREGNILHLPTMTLQVAEACSGIRSLVSLMTLAIIYGYCMHGTSWVRLALALAAIPTAILANSSRIVITGLLGQYWKPTTAEGFFHTFSGWLIFLASVIIVVSLHRLFIGGRKTIKDADLHD